MLRGRCVSISRNVRLGVKLYNLFGTSAGRDVQHNIAAPESAEATYFFRITPTTSGTHVNSLKSLSSNGRMPM